MKTSERNANINMLLGGIILATFAVVTAALVAATYANTKQQIAENEKQMLLKSFHALIPRDAHDNDLYTDVIEIEAPGLTERRLKTIPVYRARLHGAPVACILQVTAPDGYSGAIKMIVAINAADDSVAGVRVISHRETPGLGDNVDHERSNWIEIFQGKSLANPEPKKWRVKKDGGIFDQFTGATITPRAVVKAVYNTLNFYKQNKTQLLNTISTR